MATLVLGAVGGAIAGPFGAAVGALAGAAFDNRTLGQRREGPRLAELAVQTSSYGSAIPLVFGTMRVAGTVIWATDLHEHRDRSGGGKGRSATTTYSYSASFGVAVSGRRIVRVGRVWADGRLLRGIAGDLKVKATMRVHDGSEDQAADPLIAGAEGAATPAYRGIAYVVFEDLALAEFGNRIPSLTFEVVADEGGAALAEVAAACGGRAAALGSVVGYAASGPMRDTLEAVARLASGWWAIDGGTPTLRRDGAPLRIVEDAGVTAAGLSGPAASRRRGAGGASGVALAHYDPSRDYQAGVQQAGRRGAAVERIELPAAMEAAEARAAAAAIAARRTIERGRRTVTLDLGALDVPPGAILGIAGEGGRWRVAESAWEAMAVRLTLAPVAPAASIARPADGGRAATEADAPAGDTLLRLVELPASDDVPSTGPRIGVIANGTGAGWRRATLWWSLDDGASWTEAGETAAAGVTGVVEAAPPPAPATLFDAGGAMTVRLDRGDLTLGDADDAAIARGANLAAAGGELFQFGRAMRLGDGRWRIERLLRGRRGTESRSAAVADRFVLLESAAVRVIDLPVSAIGRTVRVMASGVGDARAVEAGIVVDGTAVRPPSPVKLRWTAGGLGWVRRSRGGWGWIDGVDAPLGEEREAYRVTLIGVDGARRDVETGAPMLPLSPGARMDVARVEVRQRGTWAESAATTIDGGDGR